MTTSRRTPPWVVVVAAACAGTMAAGSLAGCAALAGIEDPVDRATADDGSATSDGSGPEATSDSTSGSPPDAPSTDGLVSAEVSSSDAGIPDTAPDSMPDQGVPDTVAPADAPSESGSTSPPDAVADALPEATLDSAPPGACAARVVDDQNGLFVATTGGDTLGCGTRQTPCATLQNGVSQAQALGKSILYLANGTYVEELQLTGGLTVEGGWAVAGSTWTPSCSSDAGAGGSILQAPSGSNVTVLADAINGAAALRYLEIDSPAAGAAAGQSLYGILASGATTTLTIEAVTVTVTKGGDGQSGTTGSGGASATSSGCSGSGDPGSVGTTGSATMGSFASSGYVPGDGQQGGLGSPGAGGVSGGSAQCSTSCGTCDYAHCFYSGGTAGTICGSPGESGCGGSGGSGGSGGHGGGSSIGLFVWGSVVTCQNSSLTAGSGGAGGAGGMGGTGGTPTSGQAGGSASCMTGCQFVCSAPGDAGCMTGPTCTPTYATESGGTSGGSGGSGGAGGPGGGGSGGWSCGSYAGGGGRITADATCVFAAGNGGAGASPGGATGMAAAQCP